MARHRTMVTAGAVATLLIVVGLVTVLALQEQSNRRLTARNDQLRQARCGAERQAELALSAIDKFRQAVADDPQLKQRPEFTQLRRSLLRARGNLPTDQAGHRSQP